MCWYMPGMSHTKAVVVVPSCSIIIHPETLMKTKSLLWECDPVILGMTVSSPSGSMEFIPATKLMYIPKSLPRIRLCRKRLSWIREDAPLLGLPESILGNTRQCWDDLPQPDAAFWNEVPQPPPAQLNPPASFFGGEEPSQGWSHSGPVPLQEHSAKSSQLHSMSQASSSDCMSVALVI